MVSPEQIAQYLIERSPLQRLPKISSNLVESVVFHVLSYINSCIGIQRAQALRVLSSLLDNDASQISSLNAELIRILSSIATIDVESTTNYHDLEARRTAVHCLSSMCTHTPHIEMFHEKIFNAIFVAFKQFIRDARLNYALTKMLATVTRAVKVIIGIAPHTATNHIASLLSSLQILLTWGVPFSRLSQTHVNEFIVSDFDFSDADSTQNTVPNAAERVRSSTMRCLQALIRGCPSLVHEHWWSLLPDSPRFALNPNPMAGPNLVTVTLFDPSPRLRMLAGEILAALLEGSPLSKWASWEPSNTPTSPSKMPMKHLPSLSTKFSSVLMALHTGLMSAVKKEADPITLVQMVKTLSVLLSIAPYHLLNKLSSSAPPLLEPVAHFLTSKLNDDTSKVLSSSLLIALGCLFSTSTPFPELSHFLEVNNEKETSLLNILFCLARKRPVVKGIDSFSVLGRIAKSYPDDLALVWPQLLNLILDSLSDPDSEVVLRAVRVIGEEK